MKRLVLLGGGHAQLFVLEAFQRAPLPGVALTLVSPMRLAPYSGMMPGVIAGHYRYEQGCVDLEPLCQAARCKLIYARAERLDPERRQIVCDGGAKLQYDVLSIDTGSTPASQGVVGVADYACPVKPIDAFLARWQVFRTQLDARRSARIAVIGGGAAGVEVSLALHHQLEQLATRRQVGEGRITLITAAECLLPSFPRAARRRLEDAVADKGIEVLTRSPAVLIEPRRAILADRRKVESDFIVWAGAPAPPPWPREAGLAVNAHGFILIDRRLRSVSHPDVFAAGDVASMVGRPRPRSGVYAVRAGPHLARNLRAALGTSKAHTYTPQRRALALISTGNKHAVAAWGPLAWEGDWVWRWKDRIDRAFVTRFTIQPAVASDAANGAEKGAPGSGPRRSKRPPISDKRT